MLSFITCSSDHEVRPINDLFRPHDSVRLAVSTVKELSWGLCIRITNTQAEVFWFPTAALHGVTTFLPLFSPWRWRQQSPPPATASQLRRLRHESSSR